MTIWPYLQYPYYYVPVLYPNSLVWSTKIGSFQAFIVILEPFWSILRKHSKLQKYLEPDFKKYLYPNTHNSNTLYISIGIFGQNWIFRVKNRDYLGEKMKIIAKFKIFKLRYPGPGMGFIGPPKGYLSKITHISVRHNFFGEF